MNVAFVMITSREETADSLLEKPIRIALPAGHVLESELKQRYPQATWVNADTGSVAMVMVKEGSDIKSSADLAGKVVAVQLGTSGEALLSEGGDLADLAATFGDLMTCDSFLKCFTELGGAAVDAVIVDKPVAVSYAAENAGFTVLDEGLGAEQYGIAFRADDAELCKTIEGAVAQLVENGTYAEIAAKYPDIQNNLTLLG